MTLMVNQLIGQAPLIPPLSLIAILQGLNLTTNLKLVLDAGDKDSAPSSATSWLDRSGNGYDFFRGTTSGADATDPTFNGTVGNLSGSEYWSFDGGDYFRYDTTNETWMQNIHKDNAKFTMIGWVTTVAGAAHGICGTRGAVAGNTGYVIFKQASGGNNLIFTVSNAGTSVLTLTMTAALLDTAGPWYFVAVSVDEAVGANGAITQINSTQELFTSTYVSPASGNASFTHEIAARGNGDTPWGNTERMGMIAMWEGVALTAANLNAIFNATRGRYGI